MSASIQNDRVLAAMHKAGPYGITRVDFQLPNVIDGGAPILNFPARIHDLEHKRGVTIARAGRRQKCSVYVLVAVRPGTATTVSPEKDVAVSREAVVVPEPTPFNLTLTASQPRLAIFDDWEAA